MSKVLVILLAIVLFKMMLPRRARRTHTSITPYGSVFDVPVPSDLACSTLCYAASQTRHSHGHANGER